MSSRLTTVRAEHVAHLDRATVLDQRGVVGAQPEHLIRRGGRLVRRGHQRDRPGERVPQHPSTRAGRALDGRGDPDLELVLAGLDDLDRRCAGGDPVDDHVAGTVDDPKPGRVVPPREAHRHRPLARCDRRRHGAAVVGVDDLGPRLAAVDRPAVRAPLAQPAAVAVADATGDERDDLVVTGRCRGGDGCEPAETEGQQRGHERGDDGQHRRRGGTGDHAAHGGARYRVVTRS